MEGYKRIAKEAGVSVEEVRGMMSRAYVKGLRSHTIVLPKMGGRWMRLRCIMPFMLDIVILLLFWELVTLSRKR